MTHHEFEWFAVLVELTIRMVGRSPVQCLIHHAIYSGSICFLDPQALHHTNPFSFLPQAFRKFKSDSMDSASAWHHCIQECHAMSRLHLDGIQHHPQPDTQEVTVQRIVFCSTVSAARCTVSSFFSDDQIWFCQEDLGQPVAPAWPHRGALRNFACFFSSMKLVLDMCYPLVNKHRP